MKPRSEILISVLLLGLGLCACGGGSGTTGGSNPGSGNGTQSPAVPARLTATAGNQQVSLSWSASTGATSYNVKRATISGGPYSAIASPAATTYVDSNVVNGTAYYYVASAVNSAGESSNSSQVTATPSAPPSSASVHMTVDVFSNRHPISPYIYGGSYPKDDNTVSNSGMTVVRWGGNATSRYNWKTFTYNAANDWYFTDYPHTELGENDSAKFLQHVSGLGSNPLMTFVMLDWVAQSGNGSPYSFSVAKYGPQCGVRPDNSDAGNGTRPNPTCSGPANITGNDPNDANVPIKDTMTSGDPAGTVYRDQWAAALAPAFGSAPHFYDMDNEPDIWAGTHRDVHPNAAAYNELRDTYLRVARNLKTWDSQAVRLGPVSCCWWFYWNGADSNDKPAHAGIDLLPWWLNEVYWADQIAGTRSLDVFDLHAYPALANTSGMSASQAQAARLRVFRDFWDPTYVSESSEINQQWATQLQPNRTIAFRIPRMRALVNSIYPKTPLSITEWNADLSVTEDIVIALADSDAYGILGRERVYLASRWTAPDPTKPAIQALKLFRNYDGQHHGFESISVSATNDADPNLFSSYAAVNGAGTSMTLLVVNKDPQNSVNAALTLSHFAATQVTTYTLSQASPNAIVASAPQAWNANMTFAPYSATLLVIAGTSPSPAAEWDLNPDTIMVPSGGSATLQPTIASGSGTVTLGTPQSDSGIAVSVSQANLTASQKGTITVTTAGAPGFYHFTVPATDNTGLAQNQSGWIVIGNPPATLTKSGDGQTGARGTPLNLSVTLNPAQSGGSNQGATIFFTSDAGALSSRLVTTNSSGVAAVILTLPGSAGQIHVTAEGPFALGHPVVNFTETSQ